MADDRCDLLCLDLPQTEWCSRVQNGYARFAQRLQPAIPLQIEAFSAMNQNFETLQPNGVVTFHKLDDSRTRVMVQMDSEPEGMKESAGQHGRSR